MGNNLNYMRRRFGIESQPHLMTDSGSVVSFKTGFSLPLKKLVVGIEPVQAGSGDPSPENIRPITGWTGCNVSRTGKNLLRVKYPGRKNNEVTFTTNSDGSISVSGTATGIAYFANNYGFSTQYMTLLPPGTYTLHDTNASNTLRVYGTLYDVFGGSIGNVTHDTGNGTTFTLTDYAWYSFQMYVASGTSVNTTVKPMLEVGSTVSEYVPYTGQTYSITFPSEAGTVYGGELDVTTGVLTVSMLIKTFDGTESDFNYARDSATAGYARYKVGAKGYINVAVQYSNMLKPAASSLAQHDNSFYVQNSSAYNQSQIAFRFDSSLDGGNVTNTKDNYLAKLAELYAAGTPLQVIYGLATPLTYQLTATEIKTLLGMNNVWADTGNITELKYWKE